MSHAFFCRVNDTIARRQDRSCRSSPNEIEESHATESRMPSGGVIALDGATGAVKWKWQPSVAANGFGGNSQHRGVSVGEGKVFTTAAGNRVVALDKDTGAIVWAVQPTAPGGATLGAIAKVRTTYYDGLVYQGTNDSSRGSVFALRASDGALLWHFFSTYPHGSVFTDVNGNN